MIRIYSLYKRSIVTEITNFCKTITWSGDKDQVARKLDVTIAYSIWDKDQCNTQIGVGNLIWVMNDEREIFRGYVFNRELSSDQELKFTAFDYLIYFTKSKGTYNFTEITPEDITKTICEDAGIQVGNVGITGLPVSFIAKAKSFYEIIMQAFTYVWHFNGGKYNFMPYMDKDKFSIMNMGQLFDENFVVSPDVNLGNAVYTDTLDNMVNKVNVYNDKGEYVGTAWARDWINMYGVLQDVYESNEDDKSPLDSANSMLHGVDTTAKVTLLGDIRCKTGYAVKVKIPYIADFADRTMYIDADSHTWEIATGKYTMDLTLNTECQMKLVEG